MTQSITTNQKPMSIVRQSFCSKKYLTATLTTILFSSIVTFIIFWCTDVLQSSLISKLVVSNNTPMFEWWSKPPVRALYKIKIFNYTNVEDFESGKANKLKVEEVGPYIYRETVTRIDKKFYPNGTISFREKRNFQWEGGSPDDEIVTVPSVPLISAIAMARDQPFYIQMALTSAISFLDTIKLKSTGPFVNVHAGGLLWGYDDNLFNAAKPFIKLQKNIPFDKFGLLAYKNGISEHSLTMNTGQDDHKKLGLIERVGGNSNRHVWNDDECDQVYGTEGYMFPPNMYDDPNSTLDIYSVEMCRTLRLKRNGNGKSFDIPTLKFSPPADTFTSTPIKNSCFCPISNNESEKKTSCPPAGIFNGSACTFGLPIVSSFPHFLNGDPVLRENIDGLNPSSELHETHIEVHPRVGILIGGSSKIQINIEARRAASVPFLGKIKDGQILPLIWIEVTVDKIPEPILSLMWHAYFTITIAEIIIKWISVLGVIIPTFIMINIFIKNRKYHDFADKKNITRQNKFLDGSIKKIQDGSGV